MIPDKELWEAVVKAVGLEIALWRADYPNVKYPGDTIAWPWNPRQNNGDAFWLAVRLGISINPAGPCVIAQPPGLNTKPSIVEDVCRDPYAAARRAIWRAAVEIAR